MGDCVHIRRKGLTYKNGFHICRGRGIFSDPFIHPVSDVWFCSIYLHYNKIYPYYTQFYVILRFVTADSK